MKHPKTAILTAFSLLAFFVSCLSPQQQEEANKYIKAAAPLVVGLTGVAEMTGHLPPGSTVVVSNGAAIITNSQTGEQKWMALKQLGLEQAVEEGALKEGDRLVVDQAGTALVQLVKVMTKAPEPEHAPGPAIPIIVTQPEEGPSNELLPKL